MPLPSARAAGLLAVCSALLLLSMPGSGHAAMPGRSGLLAYQGTGSAKGILYLRRADGGGLQRLRFGGGVSEPAFSPQGRRLAFGSGGRLWVVEADGSGARAVTSAGQPSGSPTWSPRGDAVALATGAAGARHLAIAAADGSAVVGLTAGATDDDSPAWSSRDRIAFVRRAASGARHRRADGDLYVMAADGRSIRRLTRSPLQDDSPAWSPDGRRIVFTRSGRRRSDLYVVGADGRGLRRLTADGQVGAAAWSPNGRWIVFSAGRRPQRALFVVRSSGGRPRRITPLAADAREPDWQPVTDPVIAAAGDIACDPQSPSFNGGLGTAGSCHERQTSDLLLRRDLWAVLALGDLQYDDGDPLKFGQSFEATWGRVKGLMRPVPGNHEYRVPGAVGYFDYFNGPGAFDGPAGRRDAGYYSFDLGTWHVVALNSECSEPARRPTAAACAADSAQVQWLRADLAAHPRACTLAFWHHPLASSGQAAANVAMQPVWQALQDAGADVVLAGHDHAYERFAPQDADQTPDPVRGLRQFVVGTGGKSLQEAVTVAPNSQLREGSSFGVLQLTLHPTSYDWTFLADEPGGFTDAGSDHCH